MVSLRPLHLAHRLLLAAGVLSGAPAVLAQQAAPKPAAARPDPAVREAAGRIAGPFRLSSADGTRGCAVVLKPEPAGPGLGIEFDKGACADIGFTAQVTAWIPDPSGSVRLLGAQGRTVAEFTEGTGGSYEALREGDGVYFLASPASVEEGTEVRVEEVVGEWNLARTAGTPVCRWSLLQEPAAKGGFRLRVASGCDAALLSFGPSAWDVEGGNILVRSESGSGVIRFARQEDGGWARTPERGRPLLMTRP